MTESKESMEKRLKANLAEEKREQRAIQRKARTLRRKDKRLSHNEAIYRASMKHYGKKIKKTKKKSGLSKLFKW